MSRSAYASCCARACAAALVAMAAGAAFAQGAAAPAAGGNAPAPSATPAQAPAPAQNGTPTGPVASVIQRLPPDLVEAAKAQQVSRAVQLIDQGADVNARSSDGTTALLWAVHYDELPLIERLLKAHADVRLINDYGASALSQAAGYGDTAVMEKLLTAGADAESANADGQTPLMIIARTDNVAAAELLIRHGANVNAVEKWRGQTALHWAAAQGQAAMVRELLRHHANPNVRSAFDNWQRQVTAEPRVQARPTGGFTPLIYAARQGCIACAQYLIEGGANPNLTDPDGETPLLIAAENFHFDLAAYLLKQHANPNLWDFWGRTPLYATVDLNTLPYGGRPDHISLDSVSSLKLIELLLDAGANPNAQLKLFPPYRSLGADRGGDGNITTGTTPLARAARAGDTAAMRLLLAHGASVSLPNRFGNTPLMAASGLGASNVDTRGKYKTQQEAVVSIDLLVAAGADVNAGDGRGDTALHGAASWGWNDVVRSLVAHHADPLKKDAQGFTAIDAALGHGVIHGRGGSVEVHQDTADLLKQLTATNATAAPNLASRTP